MYVSNMHIAWRNTVLALKPYICYVYNIIFKYVCSITAIMEIQSDERRLQILQSTVSTPRIVLYLHTKLRRWYYRCYSDNNAANTEFWF